MKSRVIDIDVEPEDSELGAGLDCPGCGGELSKKQRVRITHTKGGTVTESADSYQFECSDCGYTEDRDG